MFLCAEAIFSNVVISFGETGLPQEGGGVRGESAMATKARERSV